MRKLYKYGGGWRLARPKDTKAKSSLLSNFSRWQLLLRRKVSWRTTKTATFDFIFLFLSQCL